MKIYKMIMLGFGNVGQALAELLLEKREELRRHYLIDFEVTALATGRHGRAINPAGLDLQKALEVMRDGGSLDALSPSPAPRNNLELIKASGGDALFENTPVSYRDGQPAIDHIRIALEKDMHAFTANKGAVVHGYQRLTSLAEKQGRKFYFESSVMDGTPIFSAFRQLPVVGLKGIRGILNSTTNLILSRMEAGEGFGDAVKHAQQLGIAETDPSGDIDGWDAAVKLSALITVLMDTPFTPDMVDRTGIRGITPGMIMDAKNRDKRYKLVAKATMARGKIQARVAPERVGRESIFYHISGDTALVEFESDVLGKLTFIEEDLGPRTTAYGLLSDFINGVKDSAQY